MHEKGFIHEDIKEGNICIGGTEDTKNTLYVIGNSLKKMRNIALN